MWASTGCVRDIDDMSVDSAPRDYGTSLQDRWLRAQAGDEAAYREALRGIAAALRTYLRRRMPVYPDDVEDVLQETLLALHLQRGTYDPAYPVAAWVTAIARHKLADFWRRHGRAGFRHDGLDDVDESVFAQDPGATDASDAQRDLQALMGCLPDAQRQAILLTKVEGLSVSEASERTGSSPSAVRVQVHRGLKRLANLVRGDHR
jgi:RNA polymerase sigma-70 factor (ECF subfamily)